MPLPRLPIAFATLAIGVGLAVSPAGARVSPWQTLHRGDLQVTSGEISNAGKSMLRTRSAEMRAVMRDRGRHAARARLRFRLLGASESEKPLGSGLVRRQIGLKLRAQDPCNLVYVMWRSYPDHALAVLVKRNPGQTTSAQCGNRGYTDVATLPITDPALASDQRGHLLEARTRRAHDGGLVLTVRADGRAVLQRELPADLTAGLDGPIGVRSDNGDYLFRVSAGRRR